MQRIRTTLFLKSTGCFILTSILTILITVQAKAQICCDQANLIANGSFENGAFSADSSVVDPNNAMFAPNYAGIPIDNITMDAETFWIEDPSRATDGNRFFYLPENAVRGKCVFLEQQPIFDGNIKPCATYQVTFDVAAFDENGDNPTSGFAIEVFYKNNNSTSYEQFSTDDFVFECTTTPAPNPMPTSSWNNLNWTRVSAFITLPPPSSPDFTFTELLVSGSNGGGILVDDICVNQVAENISITAVGTDDTGSSNGRIDITAASSGDRYAYNTTGFGDLPLNYSAVTNAFSTLPHTVLDNITGDPTTTYYLRVYESGGCFKDTSLVIDQVVSSNHCTMTKTNPHILYFGRGE